MVMPFPIMTREELKAADEDSLRQRVPPPRLRVVLASMSTAISALREIRDAQLKVANSMLTVVELLRQIEQNQRRQWEVEKRPQVANRALALAHRRRKRAKRRR
jgi:hypothetical protein